MSRVLIISGHPDLDSSNANCHILNAIEKELSNVSVRRLSEMYPDEKINVPSEQEALLKSDIIVLQFPFYWYSAPSFLKKWIDEVLSVGFAYGPQGSKLEGKNFLLSTTVGANTNAYGPLGKNHFSMEQLLRPFEQAAYFCGMVYHAPIISYEMIYFPDAYDNTLEGIKERAMKHSAELMSRVAKILD